MLLRRLRFPGTTGLIYRRVYDDLKRNHIDKFFEEFPDLFKYYRVTDHEVILPSEPGRAPSRIIFAYAETEAEVRRKFHGPEYMDMFIDQAEQLTETELKIMKTANRWPGVGRHQCKFVMFFNPGGVSTGYLRRIFKKGEFQEKERPEDYAFIQAYGWDNVAWCQSALVEDGLTQEDFYSWPEEQRFEYFINRSQYGQDLNSLPQGMRIGHLLGSFDSFEGQYFDNFDRERHTVPDGDLNIQPWHPKWISIDWGFHHPSAVLWWAQDKHITKTYREFVRSNMGPRALAQQIIDMSKMSEELHQIEAVYLSPDAFAKRTTEDSIAHQIGVVLRDNGLPFPRPADNDRVSGWMLMHEMFQYNRWIIGRGCKELIENIPLFSHDDPPYQEDCVKFNGDDPGDCARYGLKSRFASREVPTHVLFHDRLDHMVSNMSERGRDLATINTAVALANRKFEHAEQERKKPVRFIRKWRGRR